MLTFSLIKYQNCKIKLSSNYEKKNLYLFVPISFRIFVNLNMLSL